MTTGNYLVFTMVMRVLFSLFILFGDKLRCQMELFFIKLMEWVMQEDVPYQKKEIALEYIVQYCKEPSFMADLFANFDCQNGFSNIFEHICEFLYKVSNKNHQH